MYLGVSLESKELLSQVFLRSQGAELLELKRLVDAGGSGQDLRQAIYVVVTQEARRAALLRHFLEEATQEAHFYS